MSDNSPDSSPVFPPPNIPTVDIDGVHNIAATMNVVKFYVFRKDLPLAGGNSNDGRRQPFLQIVMPISGFADVAGFMNKALDKIIEQKLLPPEEIDRIRNSRG
jgi:hypothetical protein